MTMTPSDLPEGVQTLLIDGNIHLAILEGAKAEDIHESLERLTHVLRVSYPLEDSNVHILGVTNVDNPRSIFLPDAEGK